MWQIVQAKSHWVNEFYRRSAEPVDPRIRAWRARQIARQVLDLGPFHAKSNIHSSLAVELSKGCSVGCWFCALSPDRLSEVLRYDEATGEQWRAALAALARCLGPALRTGFLYWASDPLDNPDYERFCVDFADLTGVFPPTTTALAMKDPQRTRALLALSASRGGWLDRFSILTIKRLDAVHAEFSADELAHVECLPMNREAAFSYGNAGRFRERTKTDPALLESQRDNLRWAPWYTGDPAYADTDDYPFASIGCVTGFLINMVDRRVQLISPCSADDERPLGYEIYDECTFADADDLAAALERIIEARMSPTVRPGDRLRLLPWLGFQSLDDGFRLSGRFHTEVSFRGGARGADWRLLGELVAAGALRAGDVIGNVADRGRVGREVVASMLDELLRAGVLDERDG
jgi:radical SAM family RiPP maturation amino acid epimerase